MADVQAIRTSGAGRVHSPGTSAAVPGLRLWVMWVLTTMAAVTVVAAMYAYWPLAGISEWSAGLWALALSLAFTALSGLVVGLAQSALLRKYGINPYHWILATVLGWTVSSAIGIVLNYALSELQFELRLEPSVPWLLFHMVVSSIVGATLVALPQGLAWEGSSGVRCAWWWVLVNIVGWMLAGFIGYSADTLGGVFWILSGAGLIAEDSARFLQATLYNLLWYAIVGAVSGLGLVWLLRRAARQRGEPVDVATPPPLLAPRVRHVGVFRGRGIVLLRVRPGLAQALRARPTTPAIPPPPRAVSPTGHMNREARWLNRRERVVVGLLAVITVVPMVALPLSLAPATETSTTDAPVAPSIDSGGTMFRGDPGRGGLYDTAGPQEFPRIQWIFRLPGRDWDSEPVPAEGMVFIGSDSLLLAVDQKTGKEAWRFDTAGHAVFAPAVADGTVYFGSGYYFAVDEGPGYLYAVDARTGQEQWKFNMAPASPINSPVVTGGVVYASDSGGNLRAIDARSGRQRWVLKTKGAIDSEVAIGNGVACFLRNAAQGNSILVSEQELYAVDLGTGQIRWTYDTNGPCCGGPVVAGGLVYVQTQSPASSSDRTNRLAALDTGSGREVWSVEIPWLGVHSAPTVAGELVYLGVDGSLFGGSYVAALDAMTGREKWRYTPEQQVEWDEGSVADGMLYIESFQDYGDIESSKSYVQAIGAQTGKERWTLQTGSFYKDSPAILDGTLYIADGKESLFALR